MAHALLDINVVIALLDQGHVLHRAAKRWLELVEEAGFEVITTWGGFDGEPVRRDGTGDLVVVAQPA